MRRRRLLWRLYPSYLVITLLAFLVVTWAATREVRHFYLREMRSNLEARARLFRPYLTPERQPASAEAIDRLCKALGRETQTRFTIIDAEGEVLGDSRGNPATMENHGDRPEVQSALQGAVGTKTGYSPTLGMRMMYVAVPIRGEGAVRGTVRAAVSVEAIDTALSEIYLRIGLAAVATLLGAALVSLVVSRHLSRPLEELRRGADRFAAGQFDRALPAYEVEELGALAASMNAMAAQLDERIRAINRERQEKDAVLSSMMECVLAVDEEERVMLLNQATAHLFETTPEEAEGRMVYELTRTAELQRFVHRALASREPTEEELVLFDEQERYFQARGTVLSDADDQPIGALLVLNEVTRLHKLERVRSDFVANVSHELRTPITSIKGFVETLLDGAMGDPAEARRFLQIVMRQADRLNAIIDDLLSLSRIERETRHDEIRLELSPLRPVLASSVQVCEVEAAQKNIRLRVECSPDLRAPINPHLLEQAVVNLLTNAIKYSPEGSPVLLGAEREDGEITVWVKDEGCGISKQHQARLFERFYRVDKARSCKLGGTGLGLSIVKHIALAHGGSVSVQSAPERGSVFCIHLPAQPQDRASPAAE